MRALFLVPIILISFAAGAHKAYYNNQSQDAIDKQWLAQKKEECMDRAVEKYKDNLQVQHLQAIYEEVCSNGGYGNKEKEKDGQ